MRALPAPAPLPVRSRPPLHRRRAAPADMPPASAQDAATRDGVTAAPPRAAAAPRRPRRLAAARGPPRGVAAASPAGGSVPEYGSSARVAPARTPAAAGRCSATPAQCFAQALVRGYDTGLVTTTRAAGGAGASQPARTDAAASAAGGAVVAADTAACGPHHGLRQLRP